jgi:hypothetical protein
MTHEEMDQKVLGRGAKLAAVLLIGAAACALGFSNSARHGTATDDDRLDQVNQSLFHKMIDEDRQTASAVHDEVASMNDLGSAVDGK